MIVLDTHIWIWCVHGDAQLPEEYQQYLQEQEFQGLGISAISCWEIAKLVERGQLNLFWDSKILNYSHVQKQPKSR